MKRTIVAFSLFFSVTTFVYAQQAVTTHGHSDGVKIELDGAIDVSGVTDYEGLVVSDDIIPNKKYVDDAITIATVFGSEYDSAYSAGESSTTSATFQQKLRLTTSIVPAGNYRIGISFNYTSDNENESSEFRAQVDDTTTIYSTTTGQKKKYANGVYYHQSGFVEVVLTNAAHTIDIDYANNNGNTTYIKEARIEFWRVP